MVSLPNPSGLSPQGPALSLSKGRSHERHKRALQPSLVSWQEEYRRKLVTADQAVAAVQPGDTVEIACEWEPELLTAALARRWSAIGGQKSLTIYTDARRPDLPWLQPELAHSFTLRLMQPPQLPKGSPSPPNVDYAPSLTLSRAKAFLEDRADQRRLDVFMAVVSPPDGDGFCSFGRFLGLKRLAASQARTVLAEVIDHPQIHLHTFGDNRIHVSEVDCFVENPSPSPTAAQSPWRRLREPSAQAREMAGHIATLLRDGDTIEVGVGGDTEALALLGIFDGRQDLGVHSGQLLPGMLDLIKRDIINGRRKSVNPGRTVVSVFWEEDEESLAFINENEAIEQRSLDYIHDIGVIAAHDNFVAINGILAIDLLGQVTSESLGLRRLALAGGLPAFATGAMLSRGGRNILALTAATGDGRSRIVPVLEPGTIVTLPRTFVDIVVTEYGIARLLDRSDRQRAEELIAIAHPSVRTELRSQFQKLYFS